MGSLIKNHDIPDFQKWFEKSVREYAHGKILYMPVRTVEDLKSLDEREMVAGYVLGLKGSPMPPTRAMWHGWCRGQEDSGRKTIDRHQRQLVKLLCQIA